MAKASTKTVQVARPVEVTRVELILTDMEARTLAAILAKVGGDPNASPRGYADRIQTALEHAGYHWKDGAIWSSQVTNPEYVGLSGTLLYGGYPDGKEDRRPDVTANNV